jgi:hypothetical protein
VFGALADSATAVGRLRDAVDLFSAKEALAIAFQAISELKGSIVKWMAIVGFLQILPFAFVGTSGGRFLMAVVISQWTGWGMSRAALRVLRGDTVRLLDSRLGLSTFGAIVFTQLVIAVPIVIGVFLLVVPGIYLALTWSQVPMLILDGRARHLDALKASEELTRDRKLEILLVALVPMLLTLPVAIVQGALAPGGSLASPAFALFLISAIWQMLAVTFGTFVTAVVYQMLLNSKKNRL